MRKSVQIAALVLGLIVSAAARAQIAVVGNGGPGPVKAQHLTAELVSLGPAIAPGGQQTVGLVLTLEEHWHVYWVNAGDSGEPPKIAWTLPAGFIAGSMQFPIPDRLPLGPLMDYGYEEEAAFPVTITAPANARSGPAHLDAQVSWLVCADVCVPGKAHLGLDLNVQPGAPGPAQEPLLGALGRAITLLPKPLPAGAKFFATGDAKRFALTLIDGKRATDADFFPYVDAPSAKDLKDSAPLDAIVNAAEQGVDALDDGVRLYVQRSPDAASLPAQLSGIVRLSDTLAYEVSAPVVQVADVYAAARGGEGAKSHGAESLTTLGAIGLAFVGGMILNLMPCVFPVLFLKGLALVQTANAPEGSERNTHALRHSLVYALGILVSFWAIVTVLLGLRATGSHIGWGFQLQSPVFLVVLSTGLFLLALSLAGQFDIGLSLTSAGEELAQKQGYTGSFFTGVLATVVATPCAAPLMGAAVGFALAQTAVIAFAVFTAMALGLAAPYLLLSWQPAWVSLLPKPGAWMEVLKQLTAVPLLAWAIWLAWVYGQIEEARGNSGVTQIALLLGCFLLVAIAGWALGRWPARRASTVAAIVLIALGLAIPLSQGRAKVAGSAVSAGAPGAATTAGSASAGANLDVAWQPYSEATLQAARAAGRPVFIDFTAAWCASCLVNERIVLKRAEVEAALRKGNFVTMKADWTDYGPVIEQKLESLGRESVPTYVIYPTKAGAAADVLPELLTKSIVLRAIERDTK